jgi:hypothetical protein
MTDGSCHSAQVTSPCGGGRAAKRSGTTLESDARRRGVEGAALTQRDALPPRPLSSRTQ